MLALVVPPPVAVLLDPQATDSRHTANASAILWGASSTICFLSRSLPIAISFLQFRNSGYMSTTPSSSKTPANGERRDRDSQDQRCAVEDLLDPAGKTS